MTSFNWQASPARRAVIGGVVALAAAGLATKWHIFTKHYPPTPYDDLLNQIVDREPAARLGDVAVRTMANFDIKRLAARLRQPGQALARRAPLDPGQNLLSEVGGWLVPESVALYAALASRV